MRSYIQEVVWPRYVISFKAPCTSKCLKEVARLPGVTKKKQKQNTLGCVLKFKIKPFYSSIAEIYQCPLVDSVGAFSTCSLEQVFKKHDKTSSFLLVARMF